MQSNLRSNSASYMGAKLWYLSCPAVSQISNLTVASFTANVCEKNAAPMELALHEAQNEAGLSSAHVPQKHLKHKNLRSDRRLEIERRRNLTTHQLRIYVVHVRATSYTRVSHELRPWT
ncbi:unnamed protein product [Spirodela intermedia]|uniref:Uncharacterized protein n=1 Tax=Spirodela intermedia TaxID=51605 RepID=A0A7I8LL27_SPIIN|nr:unnamed protein product [Spirodela intermedia]